MHKPRIGQYQGTKVSGRQGGRRGSGRRPIRSQKVQRKFTLSLHQQIQLWRRPNRQAGCVDSWFSLSVNVAFLAFWGGRGALRFFMTTVPSRITGSLTSLPFFLFRPGLARHSPRNGSAFRCARPCWGALLIRHCGFSLSLWVSSFFFPRTTGLPSSFEREGLIHHTLFTGQDRRGTGVSLLFYFWEEGEITVVATHQSALLDFFCFGDRD